MSDGDDRSEWGTGHVFAEISGVTIKDDGANDPDITYDIEGGNSGYAHPLIKIRKRVGDERFKQMMAAMAGDEGPDASDFEPRDPPAFKCKGCNLTFPRSDNDGNDRCPDCS